MASQTDLEKRVAELEEEVRLLRGRRGGRVRYRSSIAIGDIPLVSIALGPDPARGEWRGHAKGLVAIGDIATGVVALGGVATGGICIGGLSFGLVSLGGLALGGGALGTHVVSATRRDPEAEAFFRERGLEWLCPPAGRRAR